MVHATTIHMARGCVVTVGGTWDQYHMLFTMLFTPFDNNIDGGSINFFGALPEAELWSSVLACSAT